VGTWGQCPVVGMRPCVALSATIPVRIAAADALRLCAQSLTHSKGVLGAKYPSPESQTGAPRAIVAMAHHLARLVTRMLRYGQRYVEKGIHH
jgi:hypothetical protein